MVVVVVVGKWRGEVWVVVWRWGSEVMVSWWGWRGQVVVMMVGWWRGCQVVVVRMVMCGVVRRGEGGDKRVWWRGDGG